MHEFRAVDLFAGAGGATQGLVDAGFEVVGAVENDPDAAASYRLNHPRTQLLERDIRGVKATTFRNFLGLDKGELTLLKACPPCQGFSTLSEGRVEEDAERNDLVNGIIRFARAFMPKAILIENVPGLGRNYRFELLLSRIRKLGYTTQSYTVVATDFGVPQKRRRLIVIAVKGAKRTLPDQLGDPQSREATVEEALRSLRDHQIKNDPLAVHRKSSRTVQLRINSIPVDGSRFDLPDELVLKCHKQTQGSARFATTSYGRLKLKSPAPTMTTRCTTPACGSFIHPTLNRGITLREASAFQTFPPTYQFFGTYGSIERQIGNAVPVKMAEELARTVLSILENASMASTEG